MRQSGNRLSHSLTAQGLPFEIIVMRSFLLDQSNKATWPKSGLPCVSCGLTREPILKIKIFNIVQNLMKLPPFLRTLGIFHFTITPSSEVHFGLYKLHQIQNEEISAMRLFPRETYDFIFLWFTKDLCHLAPFTSCMKSFRLRGLSRIHFWITPSH